MDQGNAVVCTAVLQQSFLISQRDLKLTLGFIVCNGITFHEARYSGFSLADSTRMPRRSNMFFLRCCLRLMCRITSLPDPSSPLLQLPAAWFRYHISCRP